MLSKCVQDYTAELKGPDGRIDQWDMLRPVEEDDVLEYWDSV